MTSSTEIDNSDHPPAIVSSESVDRQVRGDPYSSEASQELLLKPTNIPNPNKNETGGIVEKEMPIHVSNAMIYNIKTKKPDRVGVLKLKDNKKVRIYKSTGEQIDL